MYKISINHFLKLNNFPLNVHNFGHLTNHIYLGYTPNAFFGICNQLGYVLVFD